MSNPDSFVGLDRGYFLSRTGTYVEMTIDDAPLTIIDRQLSHF